MYLRRHLYRALVAQMVKNMPVKQETQVRSLGKEDHLEKGMATHSSIRAWRSPWTEKPGRLQSMRWQRVGHDWETNTFTFTLYRALKNFSAKYCWNPKLQMLIHQNCFVNFIIISNLKEEYLYSFAKQLKSSYIKGFSQYNSIMALLQLLLVLLIQGLIIY